MASFSTHEDELLIELVYKNPPLYDVRLQSYKDTFVRDNIWEGIANSLNKASYECKKRWKYIRDSYNRCKRKNKVPPGSTASSKTTKWLLFERIRFLDNIPTERRCISTVQDENIEYETNEGACTAGISGWRSSSDERSVGGTSNEGASGLRSSSEDRTCNEGTAGTRKVGKKYRKRKPETNIQAALLEYWQQRDKQRQVEIRTLIAQESIADVDGIDSFCSHMGSVLKQLPPGLRVEAKTKLFNMLSEFELKSRDKSSERSKKKSAARRGR